MAETFRLYEPGQLLLKPPSLGDGAPESHPAGGVTDPVDTMGVSAIEGAAGEERGYLPHRPATTVRAPLHG